MGGMKKIKKTLTFLALFLIILVFILNNPILFGFCKNISAWSNGVKYCVDENVISQEVSILVFCLSVFVLFFSLLTYRMHESVFRAWWNPARWWMLVISVVTLITSFIDSQSGSNIGDFFIGPPILGVLYVIFVGTSLGKIYVAYKAIKK